jgi:hypothetical protein
MNNPSIACVVIFVILFLWWSIGLTKKAEPPPTRDVNRDSGTDRANGGWLRRLVRRRHVTKSNEPECRDVPRQ